MFKRVKKQYVRLIINVLLLIAIVFAILFLVKKCKSDSNSEWEIENTPLKIENIRKIAEISTVSYSDEVVIDTIEYYKGLGEQITGNMSKLSDIDNWKYSIRGSSIKRRLTLIIGGEVRYGFDLNDPHFKLTTSQDTLFVVVSQPKILDVLIVPSKIRVFQEHGEWNDRARQLMQNEAKKTFIDRSKQLELEKKSKQQLELLLAKMIAKRKVLIVSYI